MLGKLVHRKPACGEGNDSHRDGILLMLGFVGLALRQKAVEADLDDMASDRSRPSLRMLLKLRLAISTLSLSELGLEPLS
jgi:hypothetical protein